MRKTDLFILMTVALALGVAPGNCTPAGSDQPTPDQGQTKISSDWEKDPSAWKVTIYPVYLWAPVMGANVNLENFPVVPGRPPGPNSGNATSTFNGAGFAGFEIQKSGWSGSGEFFYASINGDNANPKIHLGTDIKYGQAMAGHKLGKGFSLEGGVRRMAFKLSASVGDYPEVSRTPGVWDPLVGITWRYQAGKKWSLRAHLDGGGFGVGTDVSMGAAVRADWRFAKHFGMTMGFAGLHFQLANSIIDNTAYEKTLTIRQTLYGPVLGFGIYF